MKLLFTGDVCFNYKLDVDAAMSADILADVKGVFEAADVRIMNLETPIFDEGVGTRIKKSGPNLTGRPHNLGFLTEAGCDCAILANNHTGDFGDEALYQTLDYLDRAGIPYCGAGHDIEEAYRAWRYAKDDITFSVIAVCENEFGLAEPGKPGSAGFSMERLSDAIVREREVSEFVIVVYHGGCEHNPLPSPLCRERLRMFVRLGADAVIGGHPHCVQGREYYDGKPIIYSMGNFYFPWCSGDGIFREDLSWQTGYMTQLVLEHGRNPQYELIPYRTAADGSKISPFSEDDEKTLMAYIDRLSLLLHDEDYMRRHYMGWCVISGLGYIRAMVSKPEYYDPKNPPENIAPLRNLLSCEAHNELCRTTLKLAFEGRMQEAYDNEAAARELQKLPV